MGLNDVKKVYIPVILRNVNVNGKISFFAADSDIVKKNSKEYVKYEVGKTINIDYENIVYFLSSKFKDEYLSIVNNYDFNNMSLFDENLLHNSDSYFIFPDLTDINPKIENVKEALRSLGYSSAELKKLDKFLSENIDLEIQELRRKVKQLEEF